MKHPFSLFLMVAFCVCCSVLANDSRPGPVDSWERLCAIQGARDAILVLDKLYEGETNEAIQLLEIQLDIAVCHLDQIASREERSNESLANQFLIRAARLRQQHQRPAMNLGASAEQRKTLLAQAEKAGQILQRVHAENAE